MLVMGNRSLYFHGAEFWRVKSTQPIEINLFHLFQIMGLSQPHNSHYCIDHCFDNNILMGVYKKATGRRKAHLDLSLPGKI